MEAFLAALFVMTAFEIISAIIIKHLHTNGNFYDYCATHNTYSRNVVMMAHGKRASYEYLQLLADSMYAEDIRRRSKNALSLKVIKFIHIYFMQRVHVYTD